MKCPEKTVRVLALIKLLERKEGSKMNRLCKTMGRSQRTIFRDIHMLRAIRVPITYKDGVYKISKGRWQKMTARDLLKKR